MAAAAVDGPPAAVGAWARTLRAGEGEGRVVVAVEEDGTGACPRLLPSRPGPETPTLGRRRGRTAVEAPPLLRGHPGHHGPFGNPGFAPPLCRLQSMEQKMLLGIKIQHKEL